MRLLWRPLIRRPAATPYLPSPTCAALPRCGIGAIQMICGRAALGVADHADGAWTRLKASHQPCRRIRVGRDGFWADPVNHSLEGGCCIFIRDVLGDGETIPPRRRRRNRAAADGRRSCKAGAGLDLGICGGRINRSAGKRAPLRHQRHRARIPKPVRLVCVKGQVVGVHECGHRSQGFQNLAAIVIVDGQVSGPFGKEFTAVSQIHIHEFRGQIPAGLVGCRQRVFQQALVLDDLRRSQNVLRGRNRQACLFQNVRAIEHMLAVAHESDGHDLAVNHDQLVWLQRGAGGRISPSFSRGTIELLATTATVYSAGLAVSAGPWMFL